MEQPPDGDSSPRREGVSSLYWLPLPREREPVFRGIDGPCFEAGTLTSLAVVKTPSLWPGRLSGQLPSFRDNRSRHPCQP